jgi:hypothetical protein
MDRFDLNGGNLYGNNLYGGNLYDNKLYGSSNITTYDPGHIPNDSLKGGKTISVKEDKGESILMNSSIKKVMQKNRELHKQVVQLKSENEKLTLERNKYKKVVERYKSK